MIIRVKVFPKSSNNELIKKGENKFEARVRAQAKNNMANESLVEILKEYFPDAKRISIIRGKTRPNKTVEIVEPQDSLI